MKVKTSVSLSEDIVQAIDHETGVHRKKSEFIERALRDYLGRLARLRQNATDLEIINQAADRLNDEAVDVLTYQVIP